MNFYVVDIVETDGQMTVVCHQHDTDGREFKEQVMDRYGSAKQFYTCQFYADNPSQAIQKALAKI